MLLKFIKNIYTNLKNIIHNSQGNVIIIIEERKYRNFVTTSKLHNNVCQQSQYILKFSILWKVKKKVILNNIKNLSLYVNIPKGYFKLYE